MNVHLAAPSVPDCELSRSADSHAFEALWRSLPKEGPVPDRGALHPRKAARFLPNLVLVEVPPPGSRSLKIRLAGTGIEAKIERSITGHDYLEFLPERFHEAALQSARMMIAQPCGLWQLTTVHYQRGTSQLLEITAFPLCAGSDCAPYILGLSRGTAKYYASEENPDAAICAETALKFEFLDIGNGVPAWNG